MECNICDIGMSHLKKDLYLCHHCGLISSNIPADKTIYDRSYCLKYERYSMTGIGNKIDMVRVATVKSGSGIRSPVLDFGCGHGSFITACKIDGMSADGFDINPHSDYTDISVLFNGHKTVTFWDSLEHLAKPKQVIKGLNPKYLFISTPNVDDFIAGNKDITKWHHYYPGEHVHYFNPGSLASLLEACGYGMTVCHYDESRYRTSGGDKNIITVGGVRA